MLQQFLLYRVYFTAVGDTLDRLHRLAFYFGSQHQAGTHQSIIHQNRTGAAITRVAADLGADQLKLIAEYFCQHLPG